MGLYTKKFLMRIHKQLPLGYAKAKKEKKKIFILHLQPKMWVYTSGGYTQGGGVILRHYSNAEFGG